MNIEDKRTLIKKLNGKNIIGLKSYQMGVALGVCVTNDLANITLKSCIASLLLGWLRRLFVLDKAGNGSLLFLFSPSYMIRELHLQRFLDVSSITDNKRTLVARFKKCFDIRGIFLIFYYPIWFIQLTGLSLSFMQKIYIVGQLGICKKWIKLVRYEIKTTKPTLFTSYCDAHMYDNIAAQCCRKYGIPTATLQEGIPPVSTKKFICENFDYFISDAFLAWGAQTKINAIKSGIPSERIYIAGIASESQRISQPNTDVFGVLLSGATEFGEQINSELIKIANNIADKTGLKYIIKPHPAFAKGIELCDGKFVDTVCQRTVTLLEMANKARFFICVSTSTVAFELIHMNAVTLMHENSYENYFISDFGKLHFNSVSKLNELIQWSEQFKDEYHCESNRIDKYIFEENYKENYKKFFDMYSRV